MPSCGFVFTVVTTFLLTIWMFLVHMLFQSLQAFLFSITYITNWFIIDLHIITNSQRHVGIIFFIGIKINISMDFFCMILKFLPFCEFQITKFTCQLFSYVRIMSFRQGIELQIYILLTSSKQPNIWILNPQYFVYLLDQTVGRDTLQFIYWNHATFSYSF